MLRITRNEIKLFLIIRALTLGRISPWFKGGGAGDEWNPFLKFWTCCSVSKRFYLQWKAFEVLNKMRYILWVVTLLEACDVTEHGRHLEF